MVGRLKMFRPSQVARMRRSFVYTHFHPFSACTILWKESVGDNFLESGGKSWWWQDLRVKNGSIPVN
jgi:hypothetical protein